jgi:hypothetical protein
MGRKRPGRDADGMALNTTPNRPKPETAMQFFSSSQFPWSNSKLPQGAALRCVNSVGAATKKDCGWYDSSFDLAQGLEVVEQDCDTLYQLWELSQN